MSYQELVGSNIETCQTSKLVLTILGQKTRDGEGGTLLHNWLC